MRVIHSNPGLPKAQKTADLDAVSRLAGGVAHEFNNLLTVIAGHAELLLDDLPPNHPARASAMEIRRATRTGASVTNQLLAISRRQVLSPTRFDLNDCVWGLAERVSAILPADVSVSVDLAPDVPPVDGDRDQLERAVMNLVANARDAMPSGGMIGIGTRAADTARGPVAQIVVTDCGCGMSDDVRGKLFEPFFSTKPFGKGAGLGLATARGIVEQTGGAIEVDSAPGRGTTVTVSLPIGVLEGTEPAAVGPRLRPSSVIRLPVAASS